MTQSQASTLEAMAVTTPTAFDSLAFRRALAQFATGVVIVSAHDPAGEPIGITVSSFNAVSLAPPLVLFSVARAALSLQALAAADGYAVNVLSHRQEDLSRRFGRRLDGGKWAAAPHVLGHAQAPLIEDALARFECEPYATHDGGDHVIFVGRVVGFEVEERHDPLVFFRGGYHRITGTS
jgi:flavin reductase (DIM6/NTAB) family NADH-FMN oxidoreductase RutF